MGIPFEELSTSKSAHQSNLEADILEWRTPVKEIIECCDQVIHEIENGNLAVTDSVCMLSKCIEPLYEDQKKLEDYVLTHDYQLDEKKRFALYATLLVFQNRLYFFYSCLDDVAKVPKKDVEIWGKIIAAWKEGQKKELIINYSPAKRKP